MFKRIKKRDRSIVEFDSSKITAAIAKAGKATGEFGEVEAKKLTERVLDLAHSSNFGPLPDVEGIQDVVERVLFDTSYFKSTKAYILYREQHAQIRTIAAEVGVDLVDSYLQKLDWKIYENSNMSYSLQGLNNYISSDITSKYWLNRIYPPEIRSAHETGDLHIHDLNLLSVYCIGWDLIGLLKQRFRGVAGKVESAPPKHIRTALGQIVNFFYTLQGEAAGAQAFSNFDTLLAPFIRYDNLDYKEVKQALQEFVFNINIPTRVGFQTPFTNITMDLCSPAFLKDRPVIIAGADQEATYSDFQAEMDMINCAFAEAMTEGDARGRAFTFPIPTYNITADFDWNNPKLKMIWKMAGKYGIPYFSNFINSDMSPEDTKFMCCRLRLDKRKLRKRGGGLFGANPLTGSIGVVTINLPRIGYLSENELEFFKQLEKLVFLATQSLSIKRKILERFTDKNLYPYSTFYLRSIKQATGFYWRHHFSTIGIIGMNEACLNLLGTNIAGKTGLKFLLKVMDYVRDLITGIQKKTDVMLNLEATPAEGTSYRLALLDKERFPEILCANEDEYRMGAAPFYTNSTQLPVNHTDDIFETLMLQDELQTKYTGGTVFHIYLGEQVSDDEAVKRLIRKTVTNFRIPYLTITPTFSVCPCHGYLNGRQVKCPVCNKDTEIYSRVVGYLRPVKQWNEGKQAEFNARKAFKVA
ncbi:MAG: ribonucleoside triphosphate reductase [Desulfobacterales bacterium]|jgi:ribonucleoside-triphosphate reductase